MGEEKAYETFCKLRWSFNRRRSELPALWLSRLLDKDDARFRRFKCADCRASISAQHPARFFRRAKCPSPICLWASAFS